MAWTITQILNQWADMGVFAYVIPFLLIFSVIFAILQKSRLFAQKKGNDDYTHNRAIEAIIAGAIALLSLQFDFVSTFFANIFPRFGVGLAIFLVVIIVLGFFYHPGDTGKMEWIAWVVGIGVAIWAWTSWDDWSTGGLFNFGYWFEQYLPSLIVLGLVIGVIIFIAKGKGEK